MEWRSRHRAAGRKPERFKPPDSPTQMISRRQTPKKKVDDAPAVEPVVILAKPKPVYSAEALKLNLEGEVLLEVVFPGIGRRGASESGSQGPGPRSGRGGHEGGATN